MTAHVPLVNFSVIFYTAQNKNNYSNPQMHGWLGVIRLIMTGARREKKKKKKRVQQKRKKFGLVQLLPTSLVFASNVLVGGHVGGHVAAYCKHGGWPNSYFYPTPPPLPPTSRIMNTVIDSVLFSPSTVVLGSNPNS